MTTLRNIGMTNYFIVTTGLDPLEYDRSCEYYGFNDKDCQHHVFETTNAEILTDLKANLPGGTVTFLPSIAIRKPYAT